MDQRPASPYCKRILLLAAAAGLLCSACTPRWIVAPGDPDIQAERAPFPGAELFLTSFSVSRTTPSDNIGDLGLMRTRFLDFIRAQNDFRNVSDVTSRVGIIKSPCFVTVDAQATPVQTKWRTYILDLFFFYPWCGAWPVTPLWGTATVDMTAVIKDGSGAPVKTITAQGRKPYFVIFYSWYRPSVVEDAFREAYHEAFTKISSAISLDQPVIAGAALSGGQALAAPASAAASEADTAAAGKKFNVALIDLAGKNVESTEASIVSDILRERLFKTRRVVVVERSEMDEILKEQGFQQTGCTETNCAVEIGRLLNVEYIVVGNVSRLGSTYMVSARLVDLQSGTIKVAESVSHTGAIDGLPKSMAELARRLVIQLR